MPNNLHNQLRQRVETHAWLTSRPRLFPLLVFSLAIASVVAGAVATELSERARARQALVGEVEQMTRLVRQIDSTHSAMLRGSALFLARVQTSEAEFETLAESGLHSIDGRLAEGVGWASTERNAAAGRISAVRVRFLAPNTQRNRRAIGFDMYGEPRRRAAIDLAIRSGQPKASAPIILAQEVKGSNKSGVLLYMPVWAEDGELKGVVYTAYQGEKLLQTVATRADWNPSFLELHDAGPGQDELIVRIGQQRPQMRTESRNVPFAGRNWRITAGIASPWVLADSTRWIVLFGLVLSGLALMLARIFVASAQEERTFFDWQNSQLQVRDTLMRELNHRVKNTLANVLSIVTLTRRKSDTLESFADSLTGRIRALSATHDILTAGQWSSASLESVIRAELAPYLDGDDSRAEVSGPEIMLAPNTALSLGLAIHELATNAAKYGALSAPKGRVTAIWSQVEPAVARVDWAEQGGPLVEPPTRSGFGTDLLKKIVSHELGREVDLEFAGPGLRCTLYVPVRTSRDFSIRSAAP